MDGTGICTTCGADTEEQKEMCPDCETEAPSVEKPGAPSVEEPGVQPEE